MHERALMDDLVRKIEAVARENGAVRVTRVTVRLGALSHFTPEHFREHFDDASRGTLAEGAEVDAVLEDDVSRRRTRPASCSRASRSSPSSRSRPVMCLGSIAVLVEAWDEGGARVGRLDDGCVVPLAFVPDAEAGAHLLLHTRHPGRGPRSRHGARGARASRGRSQRDEHAARPESRSRSRPRWSAASRSG